MSTGHLGPRRSLGEKRCLLRNLLLPSWLLLSFLVPTLMCVRRKWRRRCQAESFPCFTTASTSANTPKVPELNRSSLSSRHIQQLFQRCLPDPTSAIQANSIWTHIHKRVWSMRTGAPCAWGSERLRGGGVGESRWFEMSCGRRVEGRGTEFTRTFSVVMDGLFYPCSPVPMLTCLREHPFNHSHIRTRAHTHARTHTHTHTHNLSLSFCSLCIAFFSLFLSLSFSYSRSLAK